MQNGQGIFFICPYVSGSTLLHYIATLHHGLSLLDRTASTTKVFMRLIVAPNHSINYNVTNPK